jgi:hypothetical protein
MQGSWEDYTRGLRARAQLSEKQFSKIDAGGTLFFDFSQDFNQQLKKCIGGGVLEIESNRWGKSCELHSKSPANVACAPALLSSPELVVLKERCKTVVSVQRTAFVTPASDSRTDRAYGKGIA